MQYYSEFRLELAVPLQLLERPAILRNVGRENPTKFAQKSAMAGKNFPRQFLHAHVAVVADFFVSNPPAFVNVSPLTNHIRKNEHVRLNNPFHTARDQFPRALRAGFTSFADWEKSLQSPRRAFPQELLPFPRGGSCEMESCPPPLPFRREILCPPRIFSNPVCSPPPDTLRVIRVKRHEGCQNIPVWHVEFRFQRLYHRIIREQDFKNVFCVQWTPPYLYSVRPEYFCF